MKKNTNGKQSLKNKLPKVEPVRMSCATYWELLNYIERQYDVFQGQYISLVNLIDKAEYSYTTQTKLKDTALDQLRKEQARLKIMKDELFVAAQSTYKNHPDKKIRKFWLLK